MRTGHPAPALAIREAPAQKKEPILRHRVVPCAPSTCARAPRSHKVGVLPRALSRIDVGDRRHRDVTIEPMHLRTSAPLRQALTSSSEFVAARSSKISRVIRVASRSTKARAVARASTSLPCSGAVECQGRRPSVGVVVSSGGQLRRSTPASPPTRSSDCPLNARSRHSSSVHPEAVCRSSAIVFRRSSLSSSSSSSSSPCGCV